VTPIAQIVGEHGFKLAAEPKITMPEDEAAIEELIAGKTDLDYKMALEVVPPIALADFKTIKLSRPVSEVADAEVEDMRERALQLFPHLTGPVVQAKTCLYSVTPDEHFVIGQHPEHAQVSIACGFSGHGFKFVPVVGEILADLATQGRTDLPIGLFDPLRAVLRA